MARGSGGAFTPSQRERLTRALAQAESETGLPMAVAVGNAPAGAPDLAAEAREVVAGFEPPTGGVVILVDPGARRLEIATIGAARRRIPDRQAALAVLSMTSRIGVGDVLGALLDGIRMLAETAGRQEGITGIEPGTGANAPGGPVALPQGASH